MRKLVPMILLIFLMASCEKGNEKQVKYIITDNNFGFDVNYRDGSGDLKSSAVTVSSSEDQWIYEFNAEEGDIVFVSAIYKNPNDEIRIQILLEGKVFKQGASKGDTIKYVTVSGTIPYE